jgi:hypothetical protein
VRKELAVLVAVATLGACSSATDPQKLTLLKYGAISLHAVNGAGGVANATSSAIFFEAYSANIPDSRTPLNSCQYSTVDTTTTSLSGGISGGTPLSFLFGRGAIFTSVDVPYDTANKRYLSSTTTAYTAGDSLKVLVAGDPSGFPASTISVRLAEPLAPEPVFLPAAGSPMVVRWNASSDSTTGIIISLKYANPATSPYPNEQILCSLKDDGNEALPATALAPLLASPASMRSLTLTRWRTQYVTPSTTSLLHIVTSIDTLIKLQ